MRWARHASDTPSRPDTAPARLSVWAKSSSLADLLDMVLEDTRSATSFARIALLVSHEDHVAVRSFGMSADETEALEMEVERRTRPGTLRRADDPLRDAAVAILAASAPHVAVVTLRPLGGVRVGLAVEGEPNDPELTSARDLLRLAGPFLQRMAELEVLRSAVRALRRRHRRARAALDVLDDPVVVVDAEARLRFANRRAEALLTSSPGDGPARRRAVESNNVFFSALRARAMLDSPGRKEPRQLLLIDPEDGSELSFDVLVFPLLDDRGGAESSIFVLRDVTALRLATDELRTQCARSVAAAQEARLESDRLNVVIENAGLPIVVTDARSQVVLTNREADRLFVETSRGPRVAPRLEGVRANRTKLFGMLNDFLLQSRLRIEANLTLLDPSQASEFPALVQSTKILDAHYEPTAVVTIIRDLTQDVENRHLAQELRELNARLEERVQEATREIADRSLRLERQSAALERASRLKSEFLATMSHELRTPINAVLGYNSLLREGIFGPLAAPQEDVLLRMRNAAEHLLSIINDILELSRVEAGRVQVSVSEIDLVAFLDGISETIRPVAAGKSLDFALDLDQRTPPIRTDEARLRQVVGNLLSNAVKFTEAGSVTLRAGPLHDGSAAFIEVIDTGVGIDEADRERIFEEFTQVDQSATREHGGAGLGLAISRKLVRVMGGTLQFSSRAGHGTTFRVELPLVPRVTWGDASAAPGS
jgi:signal transduction histidine kinase